MGRKLGRRGLKVLGDVAEEMIEEREQRRAGKTLKRFVVNFGVGVGAGLARNYVPVLNLSPLNYATMLGYPGLCALFGKRKIATYAGYALGYFCTTPYALQLLYIASDLASNAK